MYGFSNKIRSNKIWLQTFIGVHDIVIVLDTPQSAANNNIQYDGYSGFNGAMFGWVLKYDFNTDMYLTWWHETEVFRPDSNGTNGIHKKNEGHNGALALWLQKRKPIINGIQYRYADRKLGTPTYQDALIFTLKYSL